jgi:hypothetical protein
LEEKRKMRKRIVGKRKNLRGRWWEKLEVREREGTESGTQALKKAVKS